MSPSRLFTVVAAIGLIAAAALTFRSAGTTSAAAESVGTKVRGNMAEGILELHNRQELAADSAVASVAGSQGNWAEGIIKLHRRQELAAGSTVASAGTVQDNTDKYSFELQRAHSCCWVDREREENLAERSFELQGAHSCCWVDTEREENLAERDFEMWGHP